jgi:hypothetical protein
MYFFNFLVAEALSFINNDSFLFIVFRWEKEKEKKKQRKEKNITAKRVD